MRVYHLSSAPFAGGAARAGFRLHEGLLREPNVKSLWLDAGGGAHGPSVLNLPHPPKSRSLLLRLRRNKWAKITQRHFASTTPPASKPIGWGSIEMLEKLPRPDVWNLHWVSWFLDWENLLPWMAEQAPIVWTLHDLNPLRGIWHYEPQPEERTPERLKYEAEAIEIKRRALSKIPKDRLTFVGPSRWMVEECRKSRITAGFRCENMPYGLNTEVFKNRPKEKIREIFGIPDEEFVIGFVADSVNDPRKGMRLLMEAIDLLAAKHNNLYLLAVGSGQLKTTSLRCTQVGSVANDVLLSYIYSACDVFVCPSTQDNLPNTVLEALACNVPVVGFEIGGLPDLVSSELQGTLGRFNGGAASLAAAISSRIQSRSNAWNEQIPFSYSLESQAQSYLQLYGSFINRSEIDNG
jgi:glycosyltransferase involved in cell wall biosynthesis